jgi:hypothetical protein
VHGHRVRRRSPYDLTLLIDGNAALLAGSLPPGLSTTGSGSTFTTFGQPDAGTFTSTVEVFDQEPGFPIVMGATTFTLTVR